MMRPAVGSVKLVPGARDLAGLHERAMPQKDQLCGAFWGALTAAGHAVDQDEVALRAGTSLAEGDPAEWLPPGATPRTDYRLSHPTTTDEPSSGTSGPGLARSIEELSGSDLAIIPVAGPWTAATKLPECTLIANLRTGRLWGSRPPARLLKLKETSFELRRWDNGIPYRGGEQ